MPVSQIGHSILALLSEQPPRALHVNEIATRLGTTDRHGLALALDQLIFDGLVRLRPGQRYRLADGAVPKTEREVEGILHVNPKGFGFLRVGGEVDDVFIPAEAMGPAMHGDRVAARIAFQTRRGQEGAILDVLHRGRRRVVGVLRGRKGAFRIEPDDLRIRGPIELVDLSEPVEGDPAPPVPLPAPVGKPEPGSAAVAEIIRYPRFADELPRGRLLAVLGDPGDPDVEVSKILLEHEIDEEQPAAAVTEARAYGSEPDATELARREDLRHLKLVTIDPHNARDHDDAVWVERDADGWYRAWIAIADVSWYVQPHTALDQSALARGNSVYLPDRSVPMLPRELSSGLCSLLARQDRLCLCVEVTLDPTGTPKETRIFEATMRSHAFLTYDAVARALGFSSEPERDPEAEAMRGDLQVMWDLATELRKRRMRRGALDLDLPESDIVIDDTTRAPIEISQRDTDPGVRKAYKLIEELMLLGNESVARFMIERDLPAIFRVHGAPDPEKLERFAAMCSELDIAFDTAAAEDPKELSRFLRKIESHPKKSILHTLLLRAMKQAAYETNNIGHFGLASDAYLHFTSPIRRYADLVVHRMLRRALRGEAILRSSRLESDMNTAALTASERERLTMEAERSISDLYRALYMRSRIGETFVGTIVAITATGLYVQIPDPFVTVLVLFDELGPGGFEPDDNSLRVRGVRSGEGISLGDELVITISDVSILRRSVYGRRIPGEGATTGDEAGPRRGRKVRERKTAAPRADRPADRGRASKAKPAKGGHPARTGGRPGKRAKRR